MSRAVVVGASMAGLCAARVLADRFDEVLILDSDDLPGQPADRKGVPHGRHAHALLMVGGRRLATWFPGIHDELVSAGAVIFDPGSELYFFQAGGARVRTPSGLPRAACSRALLEFTVRNRMRAQSNVTFDQALVIGLVATGDTVHGVRTNAAEIAADLVVDASGRTCRSGHWLAELGLAAPPTSEVRIQMCYDTRVFRRDPADKRGFRMAIVLGDPPRKRVGVAVPLEGDRWMITLAGYHGDRAGTDPDTWMEFARTLPSPVIADIASTCEPLTGIVPHRLPSNLRRHVERMRHAPGGLILCGDAVASFNPTYGQGMSSATGQAEALGMALDASARPDRSFVRRYNRLCARAVGAPWRLTVGGDFALSQTTGPKPRGHRLMSWYLPKVCLAAHHDPAVVGRLVEVTNLVRPPSALFAPRMAVRVLTAGAGQATGRDERSGDGVV